MHPPQKLAELFINLLLFSIRFDFSENITPPLIYALVFLKILFAKKISEL